MGRHRAPRADRRRIGLKIRAILAGGLALGVGATVTLAAWNDSVYATTTVTASTFNIVGNMSGQTGGTTFNEHDLTAGNPAGVVTYSPAITGISPGTVSFGTVAIRTTSATNVGGAVLLQPGSTGTGTLASTLTVAVRAYASTTTCNQDVFTNNVGASIVASQLFSAAIPTNAAQTLNAAAGNTITFCVRIELPVGAPSTLQGGTATTTWQFLATSSS